MVKPKYINGVLKKVNTKRQEGVLAAWKRIEQDSSVLTHDEQDCMIEQDSSVLTQDEQN